jgi:hypothetical protein
MKRILTFCILLYLLLISPLIQANPIVMIILNELQVDSSGWTLEFQNSAEYAFDGCYLITSSDTARLKSGLPSTQNFLVITPDSLLDSLYINPTGDVITLCDSLGEWMDQLRFGNQILYSAIAAPLPGQSVSVYYDINSSELFYYLDNSPTFGLPNDFIDASGHVAGNVTDSTGIGIEGVEVVYGYSIDPTGATWPKHVYTDSSGYFIFNEYAKVVSIAFQKENFDTVHHTVQIWPDSTVTISITLDPLIGIVDFEKKLLASEFKLFQNYPNPFNPETAIEYYLPQSATIRLEILNLLGQKVRTLVAGQRPAGNHWTVWDGKDDSGREVASEVYFFVLKTQNFVQSRKMLLIR